MHDELLKKGMPKNEEAERMILGVILLDNTTMDQAIEKLKPADMYVPCNQKIYAKMIALAESGKAIDPLILQTALSADGDLESVGGPAYIASLFDGVPKFSNIGEYVSLVADCSLRRKQIHAGHLTMQLGLDEDVPAQEQLNRAQKIICDLQGTDARQRWYDAGEVGHSVLTAIEEHAQSGKFLTGIGTGFWDFDVMTGGLQKNDLIILGGRPSMGKTALVGGLALGAVESSANRADDGSRPVVGIFTLEMSKEQIVQRMQCSMANVDAMRARNGMLRKEDWRKLADATARLADLRLEIDDGSNLTPMVMRSRIRQLERRRGRVDLIILDYLQMMMADHRNESRVREVSEISRGLKAIAKDFGVPIVALASLSRKCEERTDKRPIPSDLRESGEIESDADVIAFLYRDCVYNANADPLKAELIIRKHRNGPTGVVDLQFRKEYARFENPMRQEEGSAA